MAIKYLIYIYLLLESVEYVRLSSIKGKHDFDILIFTQQWPATECIVWKKNNPQHTCNMPLSNDAWSIHGIWPTKFGTIGPAFCNKTWTFDENKIKPIEDKLKQSWVNILNGTPLTSLWAHEWNKHGTCAAQLEPLNSEYKYFSAGLYWLDKFSMKNILESSQILPTNIKAYSINAINSAIKSELNFDPAIECRIEDGKSYISEIRICFTKDLRNVNCDGIVARQKINGESILTNCKSQDIIYPHYNKWYVQLYKFVTWLQWFTL